MANVLLVIQLIISIVLIFLILIQRSEGGALGIGGGGGGGGFMSGRSATNSISRLTGILGALFIVNCMVLSVVYNNSNEESSLIDAANAEQGLTFDRETDDSVTPLASDADDTVNAAETPDATENSDAETAAEETPDDE